MHPLACVDVFNLNYPAAASARSSDGMHAVPAVANEPRHYCLSRVPSDVFLIGMLQLIFIVERNRALNGICSR